MSLHSTKMSLLALCLILFATFIGASVLTQDGEES